MDTRVAIIDDFDAACERLTPLGRYIIGNACLPVRDAVINYAQEHHVRIVDHSTFKEWAIDITKTGTWYSLDPFLSRDHVPRLNVRSIRVSRVMLDGNWVVDAEGMRINDTVEGSSVSLLDDAAASGNTLLKMATLLLERGAANIERIALCASMQNAATRIAQQLPGARMDQFVSGSFMCVHMRDACPYLPFSGRPSFAHEPVRVTNGIISPRMPTMTLKGPGPWQPFFSDFAVLHAVVQARVRVHQDLSKHLNRPARVEDLSSLGSDVVIPAYPRHVLHADTELASIT